MRAPGGEGRLSGGPLSCKAINRDLESKAVSSTSFNRCNLYINYLNTWSRSLVSKQCISIILKPQHHTIAYKYLSDDCQQSKAWFTLAT